MAETFLDDDGNPSDVAETLLDDVDSEIASTVIGVSSDNEDDDDGPDGTFLNLYAGSCRILGQLWIWSILVCIGTVSFGGYRGLVRTHSCTFIWFWKTR